MHKRYELYVTLNSHWIYSQSFKSLRNAVYVAGGFDDDCIYHLLDTLTSTVIHTDVIKEHYKELFGEWSYD